MNCLIRIDWHHFTTDQVLSGVLGFCLTAVLLQIVVHLGLLKTTHCFLLAVIAPSFEAFRVRHWISLASVLLNSIVVVIHCVFIFRFVKAFLFHWLV